jgi:hypothetical protein
MESINLLNLAKIKSFIFSVGIEDELNVVSQELSWSEVTRFTSKKTDQ